MYCSDNSIFSDPMTMVANRAYVLWKYTPRPITIDRIAIVVTTAAAAGKLARMGIYADGVNLYPGILLADGGTVLVDATGLREVVVNCRIPAGNFWAMAVSDGTPQCAEHWSVDAPLGQSSSGGATSYDERAAHYTGWINNAIGIGALANPFPAGGALASFYDYSVPVILVRISSLS
jgi:hypothetical protein